MPELRKARTFKVMFAVTGAIGAVAMIGYVHHSKSVSPVQQPPLAVQTDSQAVDQADSNEPSFGGPLPLGSVFGCNNPAPPPVSISVGRSGAEAETPDLSSPATAVYSVLDLIEQRATDELALCFCEEMEGPPSNLYPRFLSHPVGLVEVIEEEKSAEVVWEATVHTAFSRHGRQWSPGGTITLTAKLVRVENSLWKMVKLHNGDEGRSQSHDVSSN